METLPSATAYGVPSAATGMGSACPFLTAAIGEQPPPPRQLELPLVFCTDGPLVTAEECASIVHETSQHIAGGGSSSGFTLADTNRNIAVADLPGTQSWLNEVGLPRVAAMMGKCFGEVAIGDPRELFVYRALVVQYDAAAGLTHQEVHRDGSLVTCVVTLNQREEYTGGGTYIEALDRAFAPDMGCGVLQASALRHAGHTIDSGERWVLVLFISAARMKYGEHVRHLKARAQRLSEEGDVEGEVRCLTLARTLCDDADHELLYDQAVGEHERGNLDAALALYERAYALNPMDGRVAKNMAAARKSLGVLDPTAKATVDEQATRDVAPSFDAVAWGAERAAVMMELSQLCQSGDQGACALLREEAMARSELEELLGGLNDPGVQVRPAETHATPPLAAAAPQTASGETPKAQEFVPDLQRPGAPETAAPPRAQQPPRDMTQAKSSATSGLDPNVPTAEEEMLDGEEWQAAIYRRLMAEMQDDCGKGDDVACDALNAEEEAKKSFLSSNAPAWSKTTPTAPPPPVAVPAAAAAAAPPSPAFAPAPRVSSSLGDMFAAGRAAQATADSGPTAQDPNVPTAEEEMLDGEERQAAIYRRLMAEMQDDGGKEDKPSPVPPPSAPQATGPPPRAAPAPPAPAWPSPSTVYMDKKTPSPPPIPQMPQPLPASPPSNAWLAVTIICVSPAAEHEAGREPPAPVPGPPPEVPSPTTASLDQAQIAPQAQDHLQAAFESLFPSAELSMRNAESRKDGYWPFVSQKKEPPLAFTYGEFPLPFFSKAVQKACVHAGLAAGEGTFCDLGSGAGRLVLWAAATRKWAKVMGVEYLKSLHEAACAKLDEANALPGLEFLTPRERIVLREGSWEDPNLFDWSQIDVAFAYSTAFPAEAGVLVELSAALTPRLREGCIVCTTDYTLDPAGFELLEELVDENEGVGGDSVAYIYRKKTPGAQPDEEATRDAAPSLDVTASTIRPDVQSTPKAALPPVAAPAAAAARAPPPPPPPPPAFAPAPRVSSSLGDMFAAGRAAQDSKPAPGTASALDPNVPTAEEEMLDGEECRRPSIAG